MLAFFLRFHTTLGGMKRAGFRGWVRIPRDKTTRRDETLEYPLKQACFMTACYAPAVKYFILSTDLYWYYSFILLRKSNIISINFFGFS